MQYICHNHRRSQGSTPSLRFLHNLRRRGRPAGENVTPRQAVSPRRRSRGQAKGGLRPWLRPTTRRGEAVAAKAPSHGLGRRFPHASSALPGNTGRLAAPRTSEALPARGSAPRQAVPPRRRSFGPSQRLLETLAREADASKRSRRRVARGAPPARMLHPSAGGSATAAQPRSSQRPPRDLGSRWPTRRGEAVASEAPSNDPGRRLPRFTGQRHALDRCACCRYNGGHECLLSHFAFCFARPQT